MAKAAAERIGEYLMTKQLGFVLRGIDAGDLSGFSVSSAGDVNGDGIDDIIIGAHRADPNGPYSPAGESYVVFGTADGFDASVELADLNGRNGFILYGIGPGDFSGFSVSSAGDVNDDGISDIIIGAGGTDPNGTRSGESYVLFGTADGFDASVELADLDGSNGFVLNGIDSGDNSGFSVSSAGDMNGDGIDDIIIGARYAEPNGSGSGESYVVFGSADSFDANVELADLDGRNGFVLNGIDSGDNSGFSVSSAGDMNGDGIDDIIIGAPNADANGRSSGQSYVVFGSAGGFDAQIDLADLDGSNGFALNGTEADDDSGASVSAAGDVNGDGIDDIIIGAAGASPVYYAFGESYVVFGSTEGFSAQFELEDIDGTNGFVLGGRGQNYRSGKSVSSAGDVNGDGIDDILIGAYLADTNGSESGESYIVFGTADGFDARVELADLEGNDGFVLRGVGFRDQSGRSVSAAGDVNNDGYDDIIIGAAEADANGARSGESYVVFGGAANLEAFDVLDGNRDGAIELGQITRIQAETAAHADLIGTPAANVFVMFDDDERVKIRDFNLDDDVIDLTDFGSLTFDDITLANATRKDGSVSWVNVSGTNGDVIVQLRFDDETPLNADEMTADNFVFSAIPNDAEVINDTIARDNLRGTDAAERFVMLDDGQSDIVRDFEVGVDKFDVVNLNANSIDDLIISNLTRKDGSISWVAIHDASGQREMQVRFTGEAPLDAGALGTDDFVFSSEPSEPVEPYAIQLQDLDGRNKLRGTDAEEEFVMLGDGQSDIVFNFDVGVDKFEVTALDAQSFDDLTITNLYRADGSVSWISIADTTGEREMQVRFAGDIALDATALSADDFLFG